MPHKFDPARRARLEDPARAELLPPEQLLRHGGLRPGMRLADVGCGPGFFTIPAAAIVGPAGRVYAVDISEEMLQAVREKVTASGYANVTTLRATEDALPLPDGAADFALLAFVLHEAADQQAFAREVARIVARGGRVLLLDWDRREMEVGPPVADRVSPEDAQAVLEAAGFSVVETFQPNTLHYGLIGVATGEVEA